MWPCAFSEIQGQFHEQYFFWNATALHRHTVKSFPFFFNSRATLWYTESGIKDEQNWWRLSCWAEFPSMASQYRIHKWKLLCAWLWRKCDIKILDCDCSALPVRTCDLMFANNSICSLCLIHYVSFPVSQTKAHSSGNWMNLELKAVNIIWRMPMIQMRLHFLPWFFILLKMPDKSKPERKAVCTFRSCTKLPWLFLTSNMG